MILLLTSSVGHSFNSNVFLDRLLLQRIEDDTLWYPSPLIDIQLLLDHFLDLPHLFQRKELSGKHVVKR